MQSKDEQYINVAHEIGLQFAEYFQGHQCVVVTYMNTQHIHNHSSTAGSAALRSFVGDSPDGGVHVVNLRICFPCLSRPTQTVKPYDTIFPSFTFSRIFAI